MANYVEGIKVGSGEVWPVRDAEAHSAIEALDTVLETELANKAPGGFGLGVPVTKAWSEVNDVKGSGWYSFYESVLIDGYSFGAAGLRVDALDMNSLVQTIRPNYTPTTELTRMCIGGEWGEWEWVNPPMVPWHEYRTTERHNGSPVYAYCVTMTDIPDSGSKSTNIGIPFAQVVSVEGTLKHTDAASSSYPYPVIINGQLAAYAWVQNDGTVGMTSTGAVPLYGSTAFITVKYTKA